MKNHIFNNVAIIICYLFLATMCKKADQSNGPIVIEESLPVTDYDGNVYKTVKIGNQIWMAENLRTTHYSDGSDVTSYTYNNDEANLIKYGRLYHWNVAMGNRLSSSSNPSGIQGVSPDGWHIPSEAEWLELINNLGGYDSAGGKLKSIGTTDWKYPNNTASGEGLFNALPGGFYRQDGQFLKLGEWCIFLTSTSWPTPYYDGITIIELTYDSQVIQKQPFELYDAGAVRCVKDK